jgi:hypothetical protein
MCPFSCALKSRIGVEYLTNVTNSRKAKVYLLQGYRGTGCKKAAARSAGRKGRRARAGLQAAQAPGKQPEAHAAARATHIIILRRAIKIGPSQNPEGARL